LTNIVESLGVLNIVVGARSEYGQLSVKYREVIFINVCHLIFVSFAL